MNFFGNAMIPQISSSTNQVSASSPVKIETSSYSMSSILMDSAIKKSLYESVLVYILSYFITREMKFSLLIGAGSGIINYFGEKLF